MLRHLDTRCKRALPVLWTVLTVQRERAEDDEVHNRKGQCGAVVRKVRGAQRPARRPCARRGRPSQRHTRPPGLAGHPLAPRARAFLIFSLDAKCVRCLPAFLCTIPPPGSAVSWTACGADSNPGKSPPRTRWQAFCDAVCRPQGRQRRRGGGARGEGAGRGAGRAKATTGKRRANVPGGTRGMREAAPHPTEGRRRAAAPPTHRESDVPRGLAGGARRGARPHLPSGPVGVAVT